MGQGRSKKIARIEAAATALRSFIQFKDGAVLTPLKPTCNLDFTSDEHLENDALFRHAKFVKKLTPFMKVSDCTLSMTS
ncbi:PREDICTED: double-stranded RNA-specific editase Adar-like, partial [Rhagoletis zephyria]|uniref:double-stranded RNA-specific editase Adar-like n=1 Tax=Rhagoletis zephyria TaxID=28612 RepID=UPI0008118AF3